ncbi:hypothetical protein [Bordetella holmesii]|uniref:Phasin protein n=2 Tax=Bordetella holmesii TaxID=35814 RepID=A0ABP3BHD9_9BORD|nr:hypothetical protein [Bordetella holmesii]AHV91688.1 hypothetical protein D560_3428 [Bordetella holmesii ATCC 51541]AIT28040.1 hypothetical protein D558_3400 [Bordetella holmesii 44057]EWM44718.1 hypothetical protein D557_2707 [Bordetella holmesii 70147]AMD46759.1 hypothetical protein H558_15450 [Bordetella holmesii H558]AOB35657.1 hypothetical protein BBB42_09220 [Bordetella holmesii]
MKKTASQPSNPPAASLFAANLAYCQRLATLAQESQGRWAALAQQIWRDHASQYQATLAPLAQTQEWQALAPAIGDLARNQWQARLNTTSALVHTVLSEQAALAAGVSQAANAWLQDAGDACNGLSGSPAGKVWAALAEQMSAATQSLQAMGARDER